MGTFAAGTSRGFSNEVQSIASSWELAVVFAARSANHCGTAQFNNAFVAAAIIRRIVAMCRANLFHRGPALVTGLGVADDLQSLMIFAD